MNRYLVRAVRSFAALAIVTAAACGSDEVGKSKLTDLEVGMTRSAAIAKMGTGPLTATGADTVRIDHGFRRMKYLIGGKIYEVLYYREAIGNVSEPVEQALETPVLLADDKVLGWGWEFYVGAMKTYNLPTPLVEKLAPPAPAPAAGTAAPSPVPSAPPASPEPAKKKM